MLVVDDEPSIGKLLRIVLQAENDVDVATHGREALDRIAGGARYDVILCDLMMPVMTGMDLFDRLGVEAPWALERTVFITGGAFTETARAFLQRVPNTVIEKPMDLRRLQVLIRARVG